MQMVGQFWMQINTELLHFDRHLLSLYFLAPASFTSYYLKKAPFPLLNKKSPILGN